MNRGKVLLWLVAMILLVGLVLQSDLSAPSAAAGVDETQPVAAADSSLEDPDADRPSISRAAAEAPAPEVDRNADNVRASAIEAPGSGVAASHVLAVLALIALVAVVLLHRGSS